MSLGTRFSSGPGLHQLLSHAGMCGNRPPLPLSGEGGRGGEGPMRRGTGKTHLPLCLCVSV
ncbi:MAG: hypothetical protein AVDCRST_MAG68-3052 [uncultured Gemmatimonadetes bacterium]|uniref:Uncharacterized protein n=1 Tax=uncultured Gemmatimonadota bacterium TaxID=203437 RepID=A0A6J4LX62_9BACT|nr:MAG: hypothetical protein AVDCRST_MAG68-3052 [uncultured Gemmatimonadota bacterium]